MQALLPKRSNLAQTAVSSLATFVALALLGFVFAYWTWAWLAPRPEPRAPAAAQPGGRAEAAHGLFGSARRDNGAAPAGFAVGLLGVVAAKSRHSGSEPGYAVLRLDARQTVAVREGAEIEPGVRLAEVHADHVVLERNGVRETLTWPKSTRSAPAVAPRTNK